MNKTNMVSHHAFRNSHQSSTEQPAVGVKVGEPHKRTPLRSYMAKDSFYKDLRILFVLLLPRFFRYL